MKFKTFSMRLKERDFNERIEIMGIYFYIPGEVRFFYLLI